MREVKEYVKAVWWRPNPNATDLERTLDIMVDLGTTDVMVWAEPFVDQLERWRSLQHEVKRRPLKFHTWITANHHYAKIFITRLLNHPAWIAVNYHGQRSNEHPLAGQQIWPCPANRDRQREEWSIWEPLIIGTDGLHLDYIRYPDGFAFGEHPATHRVEVASQSYCYCDRCRQQFVEAHGVDPKAIPVDATNSLFRIWQDWRRRQIVAQVGWYRKALPASLALSAAVFPTPNLARNDVQQDWPRFAKHLDFVVPMIYGLQFWDMDVYWTRAAVEEGRRELPSTTRLLAGIGPHESYAPDQWRQAISAGREGGSDGEALFIYPFTEEQRKVLKQVWTANPLTGPLSPRSMGVSLADE
jgi:hypothetical protein